MDCIFSWTIKFVLNLSNTSKITLKRDVDVKGLKYVKLRRWYEIQISHITDPKAIKVKEQPQMKNLCTFGLQPSSSSGPL